MRLCKVLVKLVGKYKDCAVNLSEYSVSNQKRRLALAVCDSAFISNPVASELILLTARTRQCRVPINNRGRETGAVHFLGHAD